jgi:hypothetical protein
LQNTLFPIVATIQNDVFCKWSIVGLFRRLQYI